MEGGHKPQGSVGPMSGLPFPVPGILEFAAFRDPGKFFCSFPGIFPELSSGTPEKTPETATALPRFLIKAPVCSEKLWVFVCPKGALAQRFSGLEEGTSSPHKAPYR